jgi:hydroxypyruvate isomerase
MILAVSGGPLVNRREFSRNFLLASCALIAGASRLDLESHPRSPLPAENSSSIPLSIMLWTVFRDLPFEQRLEKVAEAGYRAVELVGEFEKWSGAEFAAANRKKRELGLIFDATSGVRHGIADPRERPAFLSGLDGLFVAAEKLECPAIILLSGNRVARLPRDAQHQSCVEALKIAAEAAEKKNVTLLLENIDPEENPDYFLTSVAEGFQIVAEVDHPRVKFLYDFYHEQISEGNLIEKLEKNIGHVGLVHVADVPGRHEPGSGEINYANIFRKLASLGYQGRAAMEFLPTGDPMASLRAAREYAVAASASK